MNENSIKFKNQDARRKMLDITIETSKILKLIYELIFIQ